MKKLRLKEADEFLNPSDLPTTLTVQPAIPTEKIVVPYSIPLVQYPGGQINQGTSVAYKGYDLDSGYLLILYYNHQKDKPFRFDRVPLLFNSKAKAIQLGWTVDQVDSADYVKPSDEIPTHVEDQPQEVIVTNDIPSLQQEAMATSLLMSIKSTGGTTKEITVVSEHEDLMADIHDKEIYLSHFLKRVKNPGLKNKISFFLAKSPVETCDTIPRIEDLIKAASPQTVLLALRKNNFFDQLLSDFNLKLKAYLLQIDGLISQVKSAYSTVESLQQEGFFTDLFIKIIEGIDEIITTIKICSMKQRILDKVLSSIEEELEEEFV